MKGRSAWGMGLAAGALLGFFACVRLGPVNRMEPTGADGRALLSHVPGPDYAGAVLEDVDFSGRDLRDADFTGAWLVGVDLTEARLDGAQFYAVVYDGATRWPKGFDPRRQGAHPLGVGRQALNRQGLVALEAGK